MNVNHLSTVSDLLHDFHKNFKYRSVDLLVFKGNVLNNLLQWYRDYTPDNEDNDTYYDKCCIEDVLKNSILDVGTLHFKNANEYGFIKAYKDHIKSIDTNTNKKYISRIVGLCFDSITDNIECLSKYHKESDFWEGKEFFPDEWKITNSQLSKDIPKAFWKNYYYWASTRVRSCREYDDTLDSISFYLLSETNPQLWAELFTFAVQWGEISRLITTELCFGKPRQRPYDSFDEDKQEENTISLLLRLPEIDHYFSLPKVERYITELKSLTANNEVENKKIQRYIDIFNKMKEESEKLTNSPKQDNK